MRRAARSCVPWLAVGLLLGACSFPDYSFAPAKLTGSDGGPDAAEAGPDAPGTGGAPATGGAGGAGLTDGAPRECAENADCAASPGGPICSPEGRCVECRTGLSDCQRGSRCTPDNFCETGCNTNADCFGAPSVDAGIVRDSGAEASVTDASIDARAPIDAARDAASDASGMRDGSKASDARSDSDAGDARDARDADSGPRLVCDTVTHTCTGCSSDDDCPLGSSCEPALGRCLLTCGAARPCPTGFSCCDGQCFNDRHTATHCGGCSVSCVEDAGRGACVAGKCTSGLCSHGRGDCNGSARDGCETNLDEDPANCGACANECHPPRNAAPLCRGGECVVGPCNTGFANCDGDLTNACEANLTTNSLDPKNCGTCGFACNLLNANQQCVESACEIIQCNAGFSNCDKLMSTGCEVNTRTDPSNCGACGKVCSFPNADSTCSNSGCRLGACIAPSANCNAMPGDGCEINTDSDPDNCGGCSRPCARTNATAACEGGVCIVQSCNPGFADCDGIDSNGCETNTNTNVKNCGACGTPCSTNHGTATCALGACSITCTGSFRDCDTDASNGCEVDTSNNVDSCGSCTKICPEVSGTANCVGGVCGISTCGGTLADCNGSAADGCEVETATSVANCGGCGKACYVANGTAGCAAGACTIASCTAGFADCNADISDGCETRLNTLAECGACKKPCVLPNANETCLSGSCAVASCITPYADCDGFASNGCETDTSIAVGNCGACGEACDSTNGVAKCLNSSCSIACNAGFANCNAAVSDGCERVTRNDVFNCGACGAVCAVQNGKPVCNVTTCAIQSCTAPFADCDHAYATGCETNTDTRIDHCGACGHVCDTSKGTPTCTAGVCILPP